MRIMVKLYAAVREKAGVDHEILDVGDGSSIQDLLQILVKKHDLGELGVSCLVNNQRVGANHILHHNDSVIIFPPIAGG